MTEVSSDSKQSTSSATATSPLLKPAEITVTPPSQQQQQQQQQPLDQESATSTGSTITTNIANTTSSISSSIAQNNSNNNYNHLNTSPKGSSTSTASGYASNQRPATSRRGSAIPPNGSTAVPNGSTSPSRVRSNSYNNPELTPTPSHHQPAQTVTRQRRSSSLIQHLEPDTLDTKIDQALNPNLNANWVDQKGAWIIHIVIIVLLKVFYNFISVLDNDWKWTLTNLTYTIGSYIMFHQVKGTPFEFNSGAYDNLTMWEQIDNGDQYTPTKKFLMLVPICLFLISTHYSHYNLNLFILNGVSCLCVVVPKLAFAHRLRVTLY
ncbi:ORM1 [Candida margitis]|uniref:ORM1 n=1 Tax=Candida margitis TaxID=1775924 RepID=UPI002226F4D4|nr:ORM1 [Candida margitis]KAI5949830.1 ORM1 [Candida margitis]